MDPLLTQQHNHRGLYLSFMADPTPGDIEVLDRLKFHDVGGKAQSDCKLQNQIIIV